jgi:cell division protein FtsL
MQINWVTIILYIVNLLYVLVTVIGAFSIRRLVTQLDSNTRDIETLKIDTAKLQDNAVSRAELQEMIKNGIKEALTERELCWLNEGRIKPKFQMKQAKNEEQ